MDDLIALVWIERVKTASAFLVALGVAGEFLGGWIAGPIQKRVDDIRNSELALLQRETAEARLRQTQAELQLAELKKRQEPRGIVGNIILPILKNAPPGRAIMEYQEGGPEIYLFAVSLWQTLTKAGWKIPEPIGVPSIVKNRGAALAEITFTARRIDDMNDPSTSMGALWKALYAAGYKMGGFANNALPDDTLRILIGPKL